MVWIKAASKEANATEPEKVPEKLEEPKVDLPDVPVEAGKGASAAPGCLKLFESIPEHHVTKAKNTIESREGCASITMNLLECRCEESSDSDP